MVGAGEATGTKHPLWARPTPVILIKPQTTGVSAVIISNLQMRKLRLGILAMGKQALPLPPPRS